MEVRKVLESNVFDADVELAMQELEVMEAPGFWTGFSIGVSVVGVAVGSAAVYTAISALT